MKFKNTLMKFSNTRQIRKWSVEPISKIMADLCLVIKTRQTCEF